MRFSVVRSVTAGASRDGRRKLCLACTGKDIACSGVPFNWNGADIGANPSGYLAGLRIGYIKESFENLDDDHAKANAEATLEILKKAGACVLFTFSILCCTHARRYSCCTRA